MFIEIIITRQSASSMDYIVLIYCLHDNLKVKNNIPNIVLHVLVSNNLDNLDNLLLKLLGTPPRY